jgi:hypothetical protein
VQRVRNTFGRAYSYVYDASRCDALPSTLPGVFPSRQTCPVREVVFDEPRMPVLTDDPAVDSVVCEASLATFAHLYDLRPRFGCIVPAAGFPTLHSIAFSPAREKVSINLFGFASKKESLILAVGSGRRREEMLGCDGDGDDIFLSAAGYAADAFDVDAAAASSSHRTLSHDHRHERRVSAPSAASVGFSRSSMVPPHLAAFGDNVTYAVGTTIRSGVSGTFTLLDSAALAQTQSALSARVVSPLLLGKVVYVEWPHLREALVVAVSDAVEEYRGESSAVAVRLLHSSDDAVRWAKAARGLQMDLLTGTSKLSVAGLHVGRVNVIISVRKLIGMRRDPADGSLRRVWAPPAQELQVCAPLRTDMFPCQSCSYFCRPFMVTQVAPDVVLLSSPAPDIRFEESGPLPLSARFPAGVSVVVLRGEGRGCLATVSSADAVTGMLALDACILPPEPPFGHTIAASIRDKFFDARRASEVLGVPPGVLGRVTGSVIVNPGKYDIGLNLKVRKTLYLPGFVRSSVAESTRVAWGSGVEASRDAVLKGHGGGSAAALGWEYTERAIHLVTAYQRAFPFVFSLLESQVNFACPLGTLV